MNTNAPMLALADRVERAECPSREPYGAYYMNSLKVWRADLRAHIPVDTTRKETLRRTGNPTLRDHEAAMAVRAAMLKVVEDALAEETALRARAAAAGGANGA